MYIINNLELKYKLKYQIFMLHEFNTLKKIKNKKFELKTNLFIKTLI